MYVSIQKEGSSSFLVKPKANVPPIVEFLVNFSGLICVRMSFTLACFIFIHKELLLKGEWNQGGLHKSRQKR